MKAIVKRVEEFNPFAGFNGEPKKKVWAVVFDDGSWFDTYKTKKEAIRDAADYGISIKGGN